MKNIILHFLRALLQHDILFSKRSPGMKIMYLEYGVFFFAKMTYKRTFLTQQSSIMI